MSTKYVIPIQPVVPSSSFNFVNIFFKKDKHSEESKNVKCHRCIYYVLCNCLDRGKQNIFLLSTLFILQTFPFKYNKYQLYAKVTHIWFLTIENVYNLTNYSWRHIEIPKLLEFNHIGLKNVDTERKVC